MKVGILSDTHNQRERAARAVALLVRAGAEALIHCGDLTSPSVAFELAPLPSYVVLGNNDFDAEGIEGAVRASGGRFLGWGGTIELAGRRIAVTHGHALSVWRDFVASRPDFLLYGHSHVAEDAWDEGVRRINPGALHRARSYTVAVLDLGSNDLEFLNVR